MDVRTNPLTMAPHTQGQVIASDWNRPYTREQAAFPAVSTLYQSSKKTFPLEHQGSSNPRRFFSNCLTLEGGTNRLYQNIGTNYQSMLNKMPEE